MAAKRPRWIRLLLDFKAFGPWPAESLATRRRLVPVSKRRMRLPDYDRDGWCLDDAEEIHRESPETFWIPDLAERQNLQPGDFVQLIVLIDNDDGPDERMWAIVREVTERGYIGMLDNEPATITENDDLWGRSAPNSHSSIATSSTVVSATTKAGLLRAPRRRFHGDADSARDP